MITQQSYLAYLEIEDNGMCMAHVLDLPGCTARAETREEALRQLPESIRKYQRWLIRHGESIKISEDIQVKVAEVSTGFGPFDPGDAAALFSPDKNPITSEEIVQYIRLMTYNRADLLSLVGSLSVEFFDQQPEQNSFSIHKILRHIGNAEEWYVSRIVLPETLPKEWENDENLPILEFLEMERRTALERLRTLTEQERSGVFTPKQWTQHPDELWTARKVFRRFLEHEMEHITQVKKIISTLKY